MSADHAIPHFAGRVEQRVVLGRMSACTARIAFGLYPRKRDACLALLRLARRSSRYAHAFGPVRYVRVGERWYPQFLFPGWPGETYHRWAEAQLKKLVPLGQHPRYITVAMVSVTSRCSLRCWHCSASPEIEAGGELDRSALLQIVEDLQRGGVAQIQLTGGEPMERYDDLLDIVRLAAPGTDLWVVTSGVGLSPERARALAAAGLTGVAVSIDHGRPEVHDRLRGRKGVFDEAVRAARGVSDAGLVLALSACLTEELATPDNLDAYARLARSCGASWIRLIEPQASGRLAGRDVALSPQAILAAESFFLTSNTHPPHPDIPTVWLEQWLQRRLGCVAAGQNALYIDAMGGVHACPFCRGQVGTALDGGLDQAIASLRDRGCHAYRTAPAM